MYDESNPIMDKALQVWKVVKEQALHAIDMATDADLHKDRDVVIAAAVGIVGGLFISGALFTASIGYLVYHFVRRDDHVRAAVEAALAERDSTSES